MISPRCAKCGLSLNDFGAVLLSTPFDSRETDEQLVRKIHLCKKCWSDLADWLKQKPVVYTTLPCAEN